MLAVKQEEVDKLLRSEHTGIVDAGNEEIYLRHLQTVGTEFVEEQ